MADAGGAGPDFRHVRAWVFDLDNTLYPSECNLFAQIDRRMTRWVADFLGVDDEHARAVQKRYYADHGTTLKGLMIHHGIEADDYLSFVHDIDVSPVPRDETLRAHIGALPGAKIVFTNGSAGHADRVLRQRGLDGVFDRCVDIAACGFEPKPARIAFQRMMDLCGVDPHGAAMFEDLPRNLAPAHALGFTTVLVRTGHDWSHEPESARPAGLHEDPPHADYVTDDLTEFLGALRVR